MRAKARSRMRGDITAFLSWVISLNFAIVVALTGLLHILHRKWSFPALPLDRCPNDVAVIDAFNRQSHSHCESGAQSAKTNSRGGPTNEEALTRYCRIRNEIQLRINGITARC